MKKWALVTGASKGIGEAIAYELAKRSWNLVLTARSQDLLSQLKEQLEATYAIKVECIAGDLTERNFRNQLLKDVLDSEIELTALVNNAGYGSAGYFHERERDWEGGQVQLNIEALVDLTHQCIPMLIDNRGYVLNIASTAAFQPGPFMAVYYATKAFVLSFSEALSVELAPFGVSVTAHCPGATESEFSKVSGNEKTMLFSKLNHIMKRDVVAKHAVVSMLKRRRVAISGPQNWIFAILSTLTPNFLVLRFTAWLNRPRQTQ